MKKTTAALLIAVGTATVSVGAYDLIKRHSSEAIWQRQRPFIERRFVKDPQQKEVTYMQLRNSLSQLSGSSAEQRCRFERLFEATLANNGNIEAAEKAIATRSFEPYEECKTPNRLEREAIKWYNLAAVFALVAGAVGLVRSLIRKEEQNRSS